MLRTAAFIIAGAGILIPTQAVAAVGDAIYTDACEGDAATNGTGRGAIRDLAVALVSSLVRADITQIVCDRGLGPKAAFMYCQTTEFRENITADRVLNFRDAGRLVGNPIDLGGGLWSATRISPIRIVDDAANITLLNTFMVQTWPGSVYANFNRIVFYNPGAAYIGQRTYVKETTPDLFIPLDLANACISYVGRVE